LNNKIGEIYDRHIFQVQHQLHWSGTDKKNWRLLEEMELVDARNKIESMTMTCIMILETQMVVNLAQSLEVLATIHTLAGLDLVETRPEKVRFLFIWFHRWWIKM